MTREEYIEIEQREFKIKKIRKFLIKSTIASGFVTLSSPLIIMRHKEKVTTFMAGITVINLFALLASDLLLRKAVKERNEAWDEYQNTPMKN